MSNQYDDDLDYDTDEQDEPQDRPQPGWRKRLENKARTAQERADSLARELAFLKAGVNPDDPKAKYFVKGYDGELTADAIKAEAALAGLLDQPAKSEAQEDSVPADEQAAHERMADSSSGAASGAARDFHAEMLAAQTEEEFHRIAREAGVRFADGVYTTPTNR